MYFVGRLLIWKWPMTRPPREAYKRVAEELAGGATKEVAVRRAGFALSTAKHKANTIVGRPEVQNHLVAMGVAIRPEQLGHKVKAILDIKLDNFEDIPNRELAQFLTIGGQISGLIGQQRIAVQHDHRHAHLHASVQAPDAAKFLLAAEVVSILKEQQAGNVIDIEGEIVSQITEGVADAEIISEEVSEDPESDARVEIGHPA